MRYYVLRFVTLVLLLTSASAWSQEFPCESAKLIVPWARGGSTDNIYRIIVASANNVGAAPRLQIVNVDGQGGAKGAKQVERAKPDGCTLLAVHQSIMTSYFIGRLKFTWDAFDPIALLTTTPAIVGASLNTPYDDIPELLEAAREKPGTIVSGSSLGSTSHFLLLMLEHTGGVRFEHFNYNGDKERITALLKGEIAVGEINFAAARGFIDNNKLKALGISTNERNPDHPGIAHYIIHACDYPSLATRALGAAREYDDIAPWVPHALHMPTHIYTRLGMWKDSIKGNIASSIA